MKLHTRLRYCRFLDVDRDGEVDRPSTALQCGPECGGEHVRDAAWVGYEPCALGYGPGHADLVDLLGCALAEAVLGRAPDDVDYGRLHVVGHGEAGNGVGVSWSREHRHSRLTGDAPVGVGHVDGGLLVAGVDEPKAFVGHAVHQREGVVSRDDEYGVNALVLEGSYYKVYALQVVCLRLLLSKKRKKYGLLGTLSRTRQWGIAPLHTPFAGKRGL